MNDAEINKKNQSVVDVFNKIAKEYVEHFGKDWEFINEINQFISHFEPDSTILDLGSGSGYITNYLCEKGLKCIGIDNSSTMINKAKVSYPNCTFILDDFANVENYFAENSVDGILAVYSLFFVPRERLNNVIKAQSKVIKPGGKFFFITRNGNGEDYITTAIMKECNVDEKLYVNYNTKEQLEKIFKENNFSIDYIKFEGTKDEIETAGGRLIGMATNVKAE